jgi:phosphoserine phosphatase RsbU/P
MAAARLRFKEHRFAAIVLAALLVVAGAISLRSTMDRLAEMFRGQTYVRPTFNLERASKVVAVQPNAESAGLQKGDIVIAVNGVPVRGWTDLVRPVRQARTGDHLLLHVRRSGAPGGSVERDIAVPLDPFTYVGYLPGSPGYIATLCSRILTPLFCLALGFWVAAVRIEDRAAWALLILMLCVANFITDDRTTYGHPGGLQAVLTGISFFVTELGPLALVYFAIIFPEALPFDRKFPWMKWLVLGPMLLHAALFGVMATRMAYNRDTTVALWNWIQAVDPIVTDVQLGLLAAFFVILIYKTVTATTSDARRRFLLLDTGAALGLLPCIVTITWAVIHNSHFGGWSALVSLAGLLLFPLSMAYVIVVHRAMDVRVVLRQGVQYLLATGGMRFVQIAISAAVVVFAATVSANASILTRVVVIAAGFILLLALGASADRLRRWIDRRFFREAYEADQILADLAGRVQTMVENGPLLETVATRVAEALHVPRIAILLDGDGAFRPAYALGYPEPPSVKLAEESLTVRRLRQGPRTFITFDDPDSWVQLTGEQERAALEELKPELLLPLARNEKVLGIMSLGPKQSEEPFSRTDLRLLDSVAAQTGLALENGRLTEAVKLEARAREKHIRELELGREVQERLFPQDYPAIPGLDYVGACRPALGVGGDYFDFLPISETQLGIAIGDVSGKGIPAALLMATLRAFLRGQSIQHNTDLGVVVANLNRLVFESSAQNRYATFFLGVFDSASRLLRYVNAGHNAPILIRQTGAVMRLEAGGCVVGLLPGETWTSGEVQLASGDLFVAYTDGISEAMNHADEEWGEEKLIEAAQAKRREPAQATLEHIMRCADEFVAGAPQFDDMTLIVARLH